MNVHIPYLETTLALIYKSLYVFGNLFLFLLLLLSTLMVPYVRTYRTQFFQTHFVNVNCLPTRAKSVRILLGKSSPTNGRIE